MHYQDPAAPDSLGVVVVVGGDKRDLEMGTAELFDLDKSARFALNAAVVDCPS